MSLRTFSNAQNAEEFTELEAELSRLRAALYRANKLIGEAADEATALRAAIAERDARIRELEEALDSKGRRAEKRLSGGALHCSEHGGHGFESDCIECRDFEARR